MRRTSLTGTGLVAFLLACGGGCSFNPQRAGSDAGPSTMDPPAGPIPGLTAIRIAPTSATLVLDVSAPPPTQQLEAYGTVNGQESRITERVAWTSSRPVVARVDAKGLVTAGGPGGTLLVTARNGTVSASASLTVRASGTFVAGGANANPPLPPDPGPKFGGPKDAARAPELVYPNNRVLFPPNVFGIEVHFRPGSPLNTLYEIRFASAIGDFAVYARCAPLGTGCLYQPSTTVWRHIAETNRGVGAVTMTVRGTDDAGTAVGESAPFTIRFSKDDVRGGLYYWTTSQGTGIMRWDFGNTTATAPEKFIGTQHTGGTCVGCHALSRDGSKILASAGGQNDGRLLLMDVRRATPISPFPLAQKSQFESWDRLGTRFVGMYTDDRKTGPSDLRLFDGATGAMTGTIPLGGRRADHPDWAENDQRIVFTSVDPVGQYTDQKPGKGGISYVDAQGTAWSEAKDLLPSVPNKNRYYPAIAPGSQVLVYNESTCPSGASNGYHTDCNGDSDPSARMWATLLPPLPTSPVELATANGPGVADAGKTELTNSYPKWAPFFFQLSEQNRLLWLTVSSTRQYGLRAPPKSNNSESDSGMLIWMAGLDPDGLAANDDPSFAAFCLPFQDITTSNHVAQWTTAVPPIEP